MVHAGAFEDGLSAVLHQFGVGTCGGGRQLSSLSLLLGCPPAALTSKDHQAEAPLGVPQRAASQQDLVVVQAAGVSIGDQVPFELVQPVVGGLTLDLTWRRGVPQTSAPLDVQSGRSSGLVSPLN